MSVATQLDLVDPERGLLGAARARWPVWVAEVPDLAVVEELLELPGWTRGTPRSAADEVLHALARLASPSGGDDVAAAGALAWMLLPGASLVAHRLRSLSPRIDEEVAAQLWLQVRGFPWQSRRKVAANIVMDTRREVLRDLGVGSYLRQVDPTWAQAVPVEPEAALWAVLEADAWRHEEPAEVDAAALLRWAVAEGVIDETDADLLVGLAAVAAEGGVARSGCGSGGLCSRRVSSAVAAQRGMGASTIRRRALLSLQALAAATAEARESA